MNPEDQEAPQPPRYSSDPEFLIWAARTGHGGRGRKLSDREIIKFLTSACFSDEALYEVAEVYARPMGWGIEEFVEEARKIGRSG